MKKKRKFAVVACTDTNLIWQAAYTLTRSYTLDRAKDIDHFLYISDEIEPKYIDKFGPFFNFVHSKGTLVSQENFKSHSYVSQATLLRLSALEELAYEYEYVLYLDADIVQRWGTPSDLLRLEGFTQPIAAVSDNKRWRTDRVPKNSDNHLLPPGALKKYMNAGVLFANSEAMLREKTIEKSIAALTQAEEPLPLADQTALNIALDGNWLELSPSWNWQYSCFSKFQLKATALFMSFRTTRLSSVRSHWSKTISS